MLAFNKIFKTKQLEGSKVTKLQPAKANCIGPEWSIFKSYDIKKV